MAAAAPVDDTKIKELEQQLKASEEELQLRTAELNRARKQVLQLSGARPDKKLHEELAAKTQENEQLRQQNQHLQRHLQEAQEQQNYEISKMKLDIERLKLDLQQRDSAIQRLQGENTFQWGDGTDSI